VGETLERVQPVQEHSGNDAAARDRPLALTATLALQLGHVAEHLLQLFLREGHLVGVELGRLPGEQLDLLAIGTGDIADGQVLPARVDVPLVEVGRLVEVVVRVVDRVGQLAHGRSPCTARSHYEAHGRPPAKVTSCYAAVTGCGSSRPD